MRLKSTIVFVVFFYTFVVAPVAIAGTPDDACALPPDLQREIASKYPGAELVRLSALDADDREFFQKDHGDACPGLTAVNFYGDGKPTFALVLIARTDEKEKVKLVLAHQAAGKWETTLLDSADGGLVPVVWRQPPGSYRDVDGKKVIRATRPVIVFTGYESWSILYAWTGNRVAKIWLQD